MEQMRLDLSGVYAPTVMKIPIGHNAEPKTPVLTVVPTPNRTAKAVKQGKAVERMLETADKLEAKAVAALGYDRCENTIKRARQAEAARRVARNELALARTLRDIALAIRDGKAVYLKNLTQKAQLEMLEDILRQAKSNMILKNSPSEYVYQTEKDRPARKEDVLEARLPVLSLWREQIGCICNEMAGAPGKENLIEGLQAILKRSSEEKVFFESPEDVEFVRKCSLNSRNYWWIEKALWERDKLARIGITTDEQLRATLCELIDIRTQAEGEDKLAKAKRELIGVRIEGFFPTPEPIVKEMLARACIRPGMKILEPSAGWGSIAEAIKSQFGDGVELSVIELSHSLRNILDLQGYRLVGYDFLDHAELYDRIIMNPPFEDARDMDHVRHAYSLLKEGGRVVSIMSRGVFFRGDKKAQYFRAWLDEVEGTFEELPDGAFKESERSTGVSTNLVVIDRRRSDAGAW